jgi:hypothetical protein
MGAVSFSIDPLLLRFFIHELQPAVFVETGTFRGDSLRVAQPLFAESHSIELSQEHYQAALAQFQHLPSVHLHHGPSPACLKSIRAALAQRPVLYWLDAHWCSAEHTSGENSQSPLLGELEAIGTLHSRSALLIDDARLYLCPPPAPHRFTDWPDLHRITLALLRLSPVHRLMVFNDVLLFYPESIHPQMTRFAHEHGVDWLDWANLARRFREKKQRHRRWKQALNPFQPKV